MVAVWARIDARPKPQRPELSTEIVAVRQDVDLGEWSLGPGRLFRVLLADGNKDAVDSLALLLKLWGHDVRQAYDGAAALETAVAYQPDILIADIAMPRMNGCQLARQLRRRTGFEDSLLISQSGYADKAHRRLALESGFDVLLVKPVQPFILQTLLRLECHRLARALGEADKTNGNSGGTDRGMFMSHENGGSTMLVLSRKSQESVMVGGSVGFERMLKVTVLEIRNGCVRLGFEVDAAVPVHRLEVWERIRAKPPPDNGVGAP
jgi:carbon storage regulator CsrA